MNLPLQNTSQTARAQFCSKSDESYTLGTAARLRVRARATSCPKSDTGIARFPQPMSWTPSQAPQNTCQRLTQNHDNCAFQNARPPSPSAKLWAKFGEKSALAQARARRSSRRVRVSRVAGPDAPSLFLRNGFATAPTRGGRPLASLRN